MALGQQNHQLILSDGQPDRQIITVADQAEVGAVIEQHLGQLAAGAVHDLDDHTGMPGAEGRHHLGDPLIIAVVCRADNDRAAIRAAHLGRDLLQTLLRKEQLTHGRQQLATLFGGLHTAFGAVEQ